MPAFIISFIIGIVCIILGISNTKGNISSLHSYHRHRVSQEDLLPFGRLVGSGTIIIGAGVCLFSVLSALAAWLELNLLLWIGMGILTLGIIIGIGISFHAMTKYNNGIF